MKKHHALFAAIAVVLGATSCQNSQKKEEENNDYKVLAAEAIEIHDEIMPEISRFDRMSLKIDSILSNLASIKEGQPELDTTDTRKELKTLQANIDAATDFMMEWMREYEIDSTDVAYQQGEIDRVTHMKQQFEEVQTEINTKLKDFK